MYDLNNNLVNIFRGETLAAKYSNLARHTIKSVSGSLASRRRLVRKDDRSILFCATEFSQTLDTISETSWKRSGNKREAKKSWGSLASASKCFAARRNMRLR